MMNLSSQSRAHGLNEVIAALSQGSHRAGTLNPTVLKSIIDLLPSRDIYSVETGCGKSTVAFSNIARHHISFCYDDRDMADSSVNYVLGHRFFVSDRTSFIFGPTQITLPQYQFSGGSHLDLVLIDGPHGFPFPDLEYWHLYPWLAAGGLLVIDDLMIPSIGRMYDILREDRMFEEVAVIATTGVLRRSHEPLLPRDGDHWWEQAYNFSKFPLTMRSYLKEIDYHLGSILDLSNRHLCNQHCVRGFEYRPGEGAATVDTSAVLRFKCDAPAARELRTRLRLRITSAQDCVGASIHANGTFVTELPGRVGEVDVEFPCSVSSGGECSVEFRLPAAKPIHDRHQNFNFRRAALTLRNVSAWAKDEGDPGLVFHLGGPLEVPPVSQLESPSESATLNAADFISTINRLSDVMGILPPHPANPREVMPPPVLCPSPESTVRFLPLRGVNPSPEWTGINAILPLTGKNWTFVDFFAFEGDDFSFAVVRSLLHRAPNKRQILKGRGDMVEKLVLVLESDYRARKIGNLGKFKDLPLARALYRLWRVVHRLKLQRPADAIMKLIEHRAKIAAKVNRRRLKERRFLLNALGTISGRGRTN